MMIMCSVQYTQVNQLQCYGESGAASVRALVQQLPFSTWLACSLWSFALYLQFHIRRCLWWWFTVRLCNKLKQATMPFTLYKHQSIQGPNEAKLVITYDDNQDMCVRPLTCAIVQQIIYLSKTFFCNQRKQCNRTHHLGANRQHLRLGGSCVIGVQENSSLASLLVLHMTMFFSVRLIQV